jgi:hypothetical protein
LNLTWKTKKGRGFKKANNYDLFIAYFRVLFGVYKRHGIL